jgi:hypothetical protein
MERVPPVRVKQSTGTGGLTSGRTGVKEVKVLLGERAYALRMCEVEWSKRKPGWDSAVNQSTWNGLSLSMKLDEDMDADSTILYRFSGHFIDMVR